MCNANDVVACLNLGFFALITLKASDLSDLNGERTNKHCRFAGHNGALRVSH